MSPRKANLESSIYFGSDGRWHGRVTMGTKNDGSPDRRHRSAKTETEIKRKVKELERQRDQGRAAKAGRVPTVARWMETYLTDIASLTLKPRSLDDYWSKTRNDIIPGVGQHRLDKLQPEHLERMYRAMLDAGHAPSHVLKVHRILSRALKIAHRRRMISENVATLVDPPSVDETEANPFTQEESKAFLEAAAKRPTFMRWIVGVGMGFRQGETLGLRWPYVDLEAELFHPKWQLQRLTWRHGCADPHACGERLHRFAPCPPKCAAHKSYKRGCPKPCTKTCTKHASTCPDRKGGGLAFTRPKTKKSQNPVPIPPVFIPFLHEHKARQEEMRATAGDLWEDHQVVFSRPDGRPLDPRQDYEEFKELLAEAGIADRRLYDGSRHTAGTILNELGVDMPTIMEILRHTQISQTRRYVKGRSHLSKDAMRRMGEFFVPADSTPDPGPESGPTETTTETTSTRTARSRRRRRIR
ncbi:MULTISPECIES: tyrosine-type recombinase/integrase [Streptomyces]|uniref:tyrosine-type recombinase/integrase n=1 Tax=Streptomyces TaxID=1883 RepID=UPI001646EAF5|nr:MULTISPECIES: tyrosine-type recombinase/integrase [Streptomyces]MBT3076589.1 tyrosine-type recombinase/integrase [Streptomyces sp. COG21]MBT3078895.1 tyrosine-type recombinase/integrase [Streptomyces sp. COG20]MBT3087765.1 tyrosine-type recombinase/integrase [Streptomyces sp. CYG21]MBT3096532.1 tyrosine-type recombinase/integrase [Streptomyces sp. CBG30]MBT3111782.1 tyrosine-type recombinase/integrase [Streptomyces sp. CYG20]